MSASNLLRKAQYDDMLDVVETLDERTAKKLFGEIKRARNEDFEGTAIYV